MKTKCYSVRLQMMQSISEKAYRATAFDGSEAIIPKSQVFGMDLEVEKVEAYWISAWILDKKELQYSSKKEAFFDSESRRMLPSTIITKHNPLKMECVDNVISNLKK